MAIKKGDFVALDFTAKIKGSDLMFDTTLKEEAEKAHIHTEKEFKPLVMCIGSGQVLPGLDDALIGKEVGDEFAVEILPEKAYGLRNPKLIQLTTISKFKDSEMRPVPGMQVSVDGMRAIVRAVSGGRVTIDFNHPLAGRTLHYQVKVNNLVNKPEEQIKAIVEISMGYSAEVKIGEKEVEIKLKDADKLTEPIKVAISEEIKKRVPDIKKKIVFVNAK